MQQQNISQPAERSTPVTPIRRTSGAARPRRRHWGVLASFLLLVATPSGLAGGYLATMAVDQYASTVGFSVRKEDMTSPIELFGGITDFASSGTSDSDILYEFIVSQEMVERLQSEMDLVEIFSKPEDDFVFRFHPTGAIEDLVDYWQRMVRVVYDPSTELIEVRALAFTPDDAHKVAAGIFDESARLVDELSDIARDDTTAFSQLELDRAVERLKSAREALTEFRSRTQIVDPTVDLESQMGVLAALQEQLSSSLIEADLLRESTRETDPRIQQAERRIAVIQDRIAQERRKFGVGGSAQTGDGKDYATLLAEYERLTVDREFAEQAYVAALASYDQAQAEARRKSRYLAAYIKPTMAQSSQYPQRWLLWSVGTFFLFTAWAIVILIFYSLRDRR